MTTAAKKQAIKDLFFNENLTTSIIARRLKCTQNYVTKVINE